MPTIWTNYSLPTSFFNNRGRRRVPNYEFLLLFCLAVFTLDKINETILKVKFFVFLRHSSFLDHAISGITITQAT